MTKTSKTALEVLPAQSLEVAPGVNLKMNVDVGLGQLVRAVVREDEDGFRLKKDDLEKKITGLRGDHTKLENRLVKLSEQLAKSQKASTLSKALAKSLTAFTGTTHTAAVSDGTIDIEKGEVRVSLQIWGEPKERRQTYTSPVHSSPVILQFSPAMKKVVKDTKAKAKEIVKADEELHEIRKFLADAPDRRQRAEDGLVLALASGQVQDGAEMLAALGIAKPKAMPLITR